MGEISPLARIQKQNRGDKLEKSNKGNQTGTYGLEGVRESSNRELKIATNPTKDMLRYDKNRKADDG